MEVNPAESGTGHKPVQSRTKPKASKKAGNLRFPAFITLALSVTRCARCDGGPLVYAAVVDGMERKLDPLPLSTAGLRAAVEAARWVGVVRPWGPPIAHRAGPGHWWVLGVGADFRPTLLAEHVHGGAVLPYDVAQATALLTRFLPEGVQASDPDAPPPF